MDLEQSLSRSAELSDTAILHLHATEEDALVESQARTFSMKGGEKIE